MGKVWKRILSLILTICLAIPMAGCGKGEKLHVLSRAEWIGKLASEFGLMQPYDNTQIFQDVNEGSEYFNQIQACAEWDIIDREDKFQPDELADVNFAVTTAVRAIGLERIQKSTENISLESEKDILEYFNKHANVKYIAGQSLYEDTSDRIIDIVADIYDSIELEQYQSIEYGEKVVTPEINDIWFSADGKSGKIINGQYNIGDIIVIEPCEEYPTGKYAKIDKISNGNFTYVNPEMDETIEHLTITGSYKPEILGVIPLSDMVTLENIDGESPISREYQDNQGNCGIIYTKNRNVSDDAKKVNLGTLEFRIDGSKEAKIGKNSKASLTASGFVKLSDIVATVDIDMLGLIVNKADISVQSKLSANISLSSKIETTIPLAKIPIKIAGVVGAEVVVAVKVGIDGSCTLSYSVKTTESLEYKPFRSVKFEKNVTDPQLSLELKVKGYIKPELKFDIVIGDWKITGIGINSGVEASIKTSTAKPGCGDLDAYLPLNIYIGAEKGLSDEYLLDKVGAKITWSIFTATNSPLRKNIHIENGEIVEECTFGKEKSEDTESDENMITEEYGNSEERENDRVINDELFLSLSTYFVALDEGRNDKLLILQLPEGYSMGDLRWTSSDSDVATVSNDGTINAKANGLCIIRVETSDGMYVQSCAVRVFADYKVDFTPLHYERELFENNGITI